ncbi:MAG: type II toxin-antitoxin system VapB family antitoxin [Bryobacteraceae bacterium]|nr:type II toxin-antitoxin system VapB family antitoxin [Bryobacteraceae bacterium]
MPSAIQIKRPDVTADVRALAALAGLSVTDAVGQAVRAQLEIERARADARRAERLARIDEIVDRFNRLPIVGPLITDDDLYDEDGLPK